MKNWKLQTDWLVSIYRRHSCFNFFDLALPVPVVSHD